VAVSEPAVSKRVGSLGAWVLACRPKTLTAAAAPVLVGVGLAAHHDVASPLPAAAALLGALIIQIATNLANDYYDFVRGGDTEARVGPVRVTQAGLLPPEAVKRGMYAVLAAALLVGVYLVGVGGWPIVWIGLSSLALAVLYTGGPFPLAYHGLGDVFVFVYFGLVAVAGTVFVQSGSWMPDAYLAGAAMGGLTTAILVVNNLRDIDTDAAAGKRTLAVRLGRRGTQGEYLLMLLIAVVVPPVGAVWMGWPWAVMLTYLVVPLAVRPGATVLRFRDPTELLPVLGQTSRIVALYGILLAAAVASG